MSVIYHHEGATSGKDEESGFKKYQKINTKKFWGKHQKDIKSIKRRIKKSNKGIVKQLNDEFLTEII